MIKIRDCREKGRHPRCALRFSTSGRAQRPSCCAIAQDNGVTEGGAHGWLGEGVNGPAETGLEGRI